MDKLEHWIIEHDAWGDLTEWEWDISYSRPVFRIKGTRADALMLYTLDKAKEELRKVHKHKRYRKAYLTHYVPNEGYYRETK